MKNPNGYGTVSKISSGKRRKPYRVQITTGYKPNREKGTIIPIRKTIGYARTRDEGRQMLARYHDELFDLDLVGVSFEYLFNLWYKYKEKAGMAENTLKLYKNYYKHYKHLEDKAFEDITKLYIKRHNQCHKRYISVFFVYRNCGIVFLVLAKNTHRIF